MKPAEYSHMQNQARIHLRHTHMATSQKHIRNFAESYIDTKGKTICPYVSHMHLLFISALACSDVLNA